LEAISGRPLRKLMGESTAEVVMVLIDQESLLMLIYVNLPWIYGNM